MDVMMEGKDKAVEKDDNGIESRFFSKFPSLRNLAYIQSRDKGECHAPIWVDLKQIPKTNFMLFHDGNIFENCIDKEDIKARDEEVKRVIKMIVPNDIVVEALLKELGL